MYGQGGTTRFAPIAKAPRDWRPALTLIAMTVLIILASVTLP